MHKVLYIGFVVTAALGCGGRTVSDRAILTTAFAQIEGAVEDLHSTILDQNYTSSGDLGSDSDRISIALADFIKLAEGKPVASDAEEIRKKMNELEQLVASGAPVAKQREAVKSLHATVAAAKGKL
jgi:hypothetical protein